VTPAEQYVAAAYLVVFSLVLAYVLIIATKLQRLERTIDELTFAREAVPDRPALEEPPPPAATERAHPGAVEAQMR
jgi:CcmD family protein